MQIVYYYVLYLNPKEKPNIPAGELEIHLNPFSTQAKAEAYKKKCDEHYGKKVHFSCVKKVDVDKSVKGIWLK